jgi:hypothetical protein
MFETEKEMSRLFESFMKTNHGNAYVKEFRGLFGIPDFVYFDKSNDNISIISFELKLKNWKQALMQAFRYRSFSELSYVVLPTKSLKVAEKNIELFIRYNIGLATFDKNDKLEIFYKPKQTEPLSEFLYSKVIKELINNRKKSKNLETFYA